MTMCMWQGFYESYVRQGGYSEPSARTKWVEALTSVADIDNMGLSFLRDVPHLARTFCGDERLKLPPADIKKLVELTLEGRLEKELTCCYHSCLYTDILETIRDIHVLPIYHAFLLVVFKAFFKDLAHQKLRWGGRSVTLKSLLWIYNERLQWL